MERKATLPPVRFTPQTVAAATLPKGRRQVVLRDPTRPGFLLVLSGGGVKSYAVQRHLKKGPGLKVTVRKTIGRADKISLTEAWKAGQKILSAISDGEDPRHGTTARGEPTLAMAWAFHVAWLEAGNGTALTVSEYKAVLERHFSDWKDVPLRTFGQDPDLLAERQRRINRISPNAATTPLRRFSAVYERYRRKHHRLRLPENPVRSLDLHEYEPRDDHLTVAQMRTWWRRVHTLDNAVRRDFHLVSFFTGCRPGALGAAEVANLNLDEGHLYFPRLKSGREFWLPLSGKVVEILRQRVQENGSEERWLFPSSTSESGHVEETDDSELVMKGHRGEPHCWAGHWLRHNFASHAKAAGVPKADRSTLRAQSE